MQVFLPESPRWLLLAGRHEDARLALTWTRGKPAREDEMALTEEFDDIKKSSAGTLPTQSAPSENSRNVSIHDFQRSSRHLWEHILQFK